MIRYRRDILELQSVAELVEEEWEIIPGGLRLINTGISLWTVPLEPHEFKCLNEGWSTPTSFTYLDKLPAGAEREYK